jgi:hypothetical protein
VLVLLTLVGCTPLDTTSIDLEPVEVSGPAPVYDTGCDLAYKVNPPDPAVIEAQFLAIPKSCALKLDDPILGPRCHSLMEKSLSGYFGEATRLEALRVQAGR